MMAAPYRMIEEIIPDQIHYLAGIDGKISRAEKKHIKATEKQKDKIVKRAFDSTSAAKELMGYWPAKFWLTEKHYAPVSNLSGLHKPILILQGGRDYQISPEKDFGPLKTICDTRESCTGILYPALNHLFMPGIGKSSPMEYMNPNHVPIEVIEDIADWVKGQKLKIR
jgi:fermentation-respiration switch protein FrsA (DUF1100 family)